MGLLITDPNVGGGGGGAGTVTSVAISGTDGIQVDSGSPITGSGTIQLGVNAGAMRTHLNVQDGATDDQTAAEILTAIKTVDGSTSGLDADFLDGLHASSFATSAQGTAADAAKAKTDFLTVTQPVDLDSIETRVNALDAAVVLKGIWDASSGTFPGGGSAQAGDSYIVSVAGTVGGVAFVANDRIIAILDNASTTTYASNWHKADYTDAVLSVASLTGAISATDLRTAINVEDGADVTDTTNVTAAGALMDSEVASLSGIKTLSVPDSTTISAFGAGLVDDADAATARGTLGLGDSATKNVGTGSGDVASGNHTHAQLHDAATVSGNGISLTGQQISLDIGTGSTQVAAGNHTHSGVYQPADTQLDSLAALSYAGNTLKVVRVNSGETGFELASVSVGGGDLLAANNLSDLANAATARTNLGLGTAATTDASAYATAAQGTDERVPTAAGLTSKFGTNKASIADGDKFGMLDGAASDVPKHTLWSLIKSTLKAYFDSLYATAAQGTSADAAKTKTDFLTVTQAVDLDALETASHAAATVGATLADVMSLSGQALTATDLGADKLWFWDESAGKIVPLTLGTGLSITDTTIAATGGGGLTNFTETLLTSSPNATVNVAQLEVTGGTTNAIAAITPKGNAGVVIGLPPATGVRNQPGTGAFDASITRTSATEVASGTDSFQAGKKVTTSGASASSLGEEVNTSGSQGAHSAGYGITNSAKQGMALGGLLTLSGEYNSIAGGYSSQVTSSGCGRMMADWSAATGPCSTTLGTYASNDRNGTLVHASGRYSGTGDCQFVLGTMRATTSDATPTELFFNTPIGGSTRLTIPASGIIAGIYNIVATRTDGSAVAHFIRQFAYKNVAGTTTEVYAPVTLGTDNAAGVSITLSANDTNDAAKVEFTGISSQNWRVACTVIITDIKYTS